MAPYTISVTTYTKTGTRETTPGYVPVASDALISLFGKTLKEFKTKRQAAAALMSLMAQAGQYGPVISGTVHNVN